MMDEENQTPLLTEIKQEKEDDSEEVTADHEDLRSIDRSFDNDLDEVSSMKNENESIDKDMSENAKSDDDMQGYDTRSEVGSTLTSDSESGDDACSSKSFDVKRKRHDKTVSSQVNSFQEKHRKPDSISPLKRNSSEYIGKLNYLFRDARFFIIKSSNAENIALSKVKGVWATLPQNQVKLSEAFRSSENVILIFSAKESGKFSGFARLATGVDRSISPVPWIVPAELTPNLLKGTFRIDWICRNDLPFSFTTTLYNPWNCNKPVKIARDGQEVEPRVGEKLCRLFPKDDDIDLAPILRKSKDEAKNKRGSDSIKSIYTSKVRSKMLQNHKFLRDKKGMLHRTRDDNRIIKHYKTRPITIPKNFHDMQNKAPLRGRVMTSIESYVKRFNHSLRPPLPVPFLPPPHPSSDMFSSPFAHLPLPQPPVMPRYYDPLPAFSHFPKLTPMPPNKHMYDRSVEEFLFKTRDKNFHPMKKENRTKRRENDGRGKRAHYHDKYRNSK
ncbi:YTH domain-containing protein 1 [Planococcus citri]|uniref:YTH domain-containing protein 1 n=1 Tax=Planococcus citri TaxID=170843 RepID=UPI0031F99FFF